MSVAYRSVTGKRKNTTEYLSNNKLKRLALQLFIK